MKQKEVNLMPSILYEVRAGIAIVTLNRESALNTIDTSTAERLQAVIADISNNDQVKLAIFTGTGNRAFCAGEDLNDPSIHSAEGLIRFTGRLNDIFNEIEMLPQPTIAAINGFAFGAGFELALACDLRISADQTLMGLPQAKLGLIPGAGGTQRLPRLIGEAKALELILTAKRFTSLEAYHFGILSKVVSNHELHKEVMYTAEQILENAPIAIYQAKHAVKKGMRTDLKAGLELEKEGFLKTASSQDLEEGIQSFFEKKKPVFRGK
ncbi:enoyl-CoA hydratase-related protein [Actinomycetes bacterium NPDC127524]